MTGTDNHSTDSGRGEDPEAGADDPDGDAVECPADDCEDAVDGGADHDAAVDPSTDRGRGRPVPDRVRVEGERTPSEAVLRAVEAAAGVDLADSDERLGDVIDADALDALFGPAAVGQDDDPGHVEFAFCGCRVTVESDGCVYATPDDAT